MAPPSGGYGSYTSRFVTEDWPSDYTRPQSLNRWSYSLSNPVKYTDPSGHDPWWCDTTPNPQQCRQSYYANIRELWLNAYVQRLIGDINLQFDPFQGSLNLPADVNYKDSVYEERDRLIAEAYIVLGVDLETIARNQISNPVTERDFLDCGLPVEIDWVQQRTLAASRHLPFVLFIERVRIPRSHLMNFEPNYLNALMLNNPRELKQAKIAYIEKRVEFGELEGSIANLAEQLVTGGN